MLVDLELQVFAQVQGDTPSQRARIRRGPRRRFCKHKTVSMVVHESSSVYRLLPLKW